MGNGSKGVHASNGGTKCIATWLPLGCTTVVTSQRIQATDEVLFARHRPTHSCSAKEEEVDDVVSKRLKLLIGLRISNKLQTELMAVTAMKT